MTIQDKTKDDREWKSDLVIGTTIVSVLLFGSLWNYFQEDPHVRACEELGQYLLDRPLVQYYDDDYSYEYERFKAECGDVYDLEAIQ